MVLGRECTTLDIHEIQLEEMTHIQLLKKCKDSIPFSFDQYDMRNKTESIIMCDSCPCHAFFDTMQKSGHLSDCSVDGESFLASLNVLDHCTCKQ